MTIIIDIAVYLSHFGALNLEIRFIEGIEHVRMKNEHTTDTAFEAGDDSVYIKTLLSSVMVVQGRMEKNSSSTNSNPDFKYLNYCANISRETEHRTLTSSKFP